MPHRRFNSRAVRLLFISGILSLTTMVHAQFSNVSDVEAAPIPGVGHDYIHMLNETVNPANGSLSVRIDVPVPQGRKLTVPFSFQYNSNGAIPITSSGALPTYYQLGWSYGIPNVTSQRVTLTGTYDGSKAVCLLNSGYLFWAPNGTQHALGLVSGAIGAGCSELGYSNKSIGGDPLVSASITSAGNVVVSDADGTTYTFASGTSVEDRNGNRVSVSGATITDTAGRTAVSASGFGSTGNTVAVSGLVNPYTVNWATTATYNYRTNQELVYSPQYSTCNGLPLNVNPNGSSAIISSIELPNGQSYQFYYDSTYGLLKEIIYPTGAWVKYTWGVNAQSEAVEGPAVLENKQPGYCDYRFDNPAIIERQVSYNGSTVAEQQTFSYSTAWQTGSLAFKWSSKSTTVTTTDELRGQSFKTVYSYGPVTIQPPPFMGTVMGTQVPVESSVANYDWNGLFLSAVDKSWLNQYLLASELTVMPTGSNAQISYSYGNLGVVTAKTEYDYGQTTATRQTVTNYQSFPANPLGSEIYDRPCQVIIENGSGTRYAETDYFYDNGGTGTVCGTAGSPSVTDVAGLTEHDESNYGPGSTAPRGNVTTETQWQNTGTSSTTTYTYDEAGQMLSLTDPCGNSACTDMTGTSHTTTYSFADSYSSGTPLGVTDTYLTSTSDPLNHLSSFKYSYADGQVTSSTDPNSKITQYIYNTPPSGCSYADGLDRLSQVTYPDFGETTYCYDDAVPSVTLSTLLNASNAWETNVSTMDGVGHVIQTQLTSDPYGTDTVTTTYDGEGKIFRRTNPQRSGSLPTDGTSTFYFDALGRQLEVVQQDGSNLQWCYLGTSSTPAVANCSGRLGSVTTGSWVDFTDEVGNHWQRTSDSFGRLTEAMEPSGVTQSPTLETDYAYDPLNNLLSVNQCGGGCPSGTAEGRSFQYDSLSRLLKAINPEAGTNTYTYDLNGNLQNRTDGRSVGTNYTYDVLNRVLAKTYTDGVTLPVSYSYDTSSITGATNTVGHLTSESVMNGTTLVAWRAPYKYDPMGRIQGEEQCSPANCAGVAYTPTYTFDMTGGVATATAGLPSSVNGAPSSAMQFTYAYDNAHRLSSVTSSVPEGASYPPTLFQASMYWPTEFLAEASLGVNGTTGTTVAQLNRTYNNRGWIQSESDGVYSFSIPTSGGYDGAGNLKSATDSVTGTWSYTYDTLNRLITGNSAATNTPSQYANYSGCWAYDAFGNRIMQLVQTLACPAPPTPGQYPATAYYNSSNHVTFVNQAAPSSISAPSGFTYDAAGNVLNDSVSAYLYDGESRICAVRNLTVGTMTAYIYGADGTRVAKGTLSSWPAACPAPSTNGFSLTASYVLGLGGEQVSEVNGSGIWQHTNIYAGGKLLASYHDTQTYFALNDWLGTKRVEYGANGCLSTFFSLPYGDALAPSGNCPSDATEHHLTGKERDTESGNDYFGARYYASSMGRWMSPDSGADSTMGVPVPFAELTNPQSLNLYAYAGNSPLSNVDPDGNDYVTVCADGQTSNCPTYTPEQWANIVAAQKQAGNGITISGQGPDNTGTINCGGTACGSATFHESGAQDASGNLLMFVVPTEGLVGPALGAIGKAISGLFGREAVDAAAEEGAKVLLSGGTKQAAKDIVDEMADGAQKASVKRGVAAATNSESVTIKQGADGSIQVIRTRPGVDGSQTFTKTIDASGNSSTVQTAHDAAGNLVHYDPKN
jgi:RHS repeat-associated protein